MSTFSILIPTFNRKEKLRVVLEELSKQERISDGEVIVGLDGSRDGTLEMLQDLSGSFPGKLSFFRIENSGRSVIRNRLLEKAEGDLILFIQDDIVVTPFWLEAHREAHTWHPNAAIVGHITWYPKMTITPYMQWLENGGPLVSFRGLRDFGETNFCHFYMGNISFPKNAIEGIRFDESLKEYGWEDILFGFQFVQRGGKIFYSQKALAYHWDEYREENLPQYAQKLGKSAKIVQQKYPEIGVYPPLWKRVVLRWVIFLGSIFWPFLSKQKCWYLMLKKHFLANPPNTP